MALAANRAFVCVATVAAVGGKKLSLIKASFKDNLYFIFPM